MNSELDNAKVNKHKKRLHRHGRIKCLARSVFCSKRNGSKLTSVRLGTLCPICGFNPNETAKKWMRETRLQTRRTRDYRLPAK